MGLIVSQPGVSDQGAADTGLLGLLRAGHPARLPLLCPPPCSGTLPPELPAFLLLPGNVIHCPASHISVFSPDIFLSSGLTNPALCWTVPPPWPANALSPRKLKLNPSSLACSSPWFVSFKYSFIHSFSLFHLPAHPSIIVVKYTQHKIYPF